MAALAASGTGKESVDLTAPDTAGTYYYGACVDAVTAETDATDNCSTSVKVAVPSTTEPQDRQDQQDLVVTSPTVSDGAPAAGTEFTLSVTVSNAGGEAATPTTVRYYQSADATITTSDTEVGTGAVAKLAPLGSGSPVDDRAVHARDVLLARWPTSRTWLPRSPERSGGRGRHRDELHAIGDGRPPRRRALLPFDGRHDHDSDTQVGTGAGGACRCGQRQPVGGPGGAVHAGDLLLRSVRGSGGG